METQVSLGEHCQCIDSTVLDKLLEIQASWCIH